MKLLIDNCFSRRFAQMLVAAYEQDLTARALITADTDQIRVRRD